MQRPLRRFKKNKLVAKPQLVPVMDAMFIMIFFILSTAEFLKIAEIGSDLPVMKLSTEENPKKKKMILRMLLSTEKLTLVNEADQTQLFSNPWDENVYQLLNDKVRSIKNDYPDEERVVVVPDLSIKYDILVKALDAVRQSEQSGINIKLFNQIIFR